MNLKLNTQHSVKELLGLGIQPDILFVELKKFDKEARQKISLFCNLSLESVIMVENARSIYEVPLKLYKEGVIKEVYSHFNIKKNKIKSIMGKVFRKV